MACLFTFRSTISCFFQLNVRCIISCSGGLGVCRQHKRGLGILGVHSHSLCRVSSTVSLITGISRQKQEDTPAVPCSPDLLSHAVSVHPSATFPLPCLLLLFFWLSLLSATALGCLVLVLFRFHLVLPSRIASANHQCSLHTVRRSPISIKPPTAHFAPGTPVSRALSQPIRQPCQEQ